MNRFLCFITLFLLLSCSSEKPAEVSSQKPSDSKKDTVSTAPQQQIAVSETTLSLEITPVEATRNSTLNPAPKGFNLSDAKIIWLVNGNPVSVVIPNQFKAVDAKKGDKVQAKAIIQDREIFSNAITIKNAPPEISKVKIMPEVFRPGDTLYVEASGNDIDGDEVTLTYEWTKNGVPAGNGNKIEVPIKRGDEISIKITPFDGETYGRPIVLHRAIANLPPVIIEDKKVNFDGKLWTYQVKAFDPDGDALTYSLKSGPSGMTVNASTGLITWDVPKDFVGKAPASIVVSDGHGGEAVENFNAVIRVEK